MRRLAAKFYSSVDNGLAESFRGCPWLDLMAEGALSILTAADGEGNREGKENAAESDKPRPGFAFGP